MLNEEEVLARANELYARACWKRAGRDPDDLGYVAPEARPIIASEQVRCLLAALVEALNGRVQF